MLSGRDTLAQRPLELSEERGIERHRNHVAESIRETLLNVSRFLLDSRRASDLTGDRESLSPEGNINPHLQPYIETEATLIYEE